MADNNSRCTIYTLHSPTRALIQTWLGFCALSFSLVTARLSAQTTSPASTPVSSISFAPAHLQFFGDVFIDAKFLYETRQEPNPLGVSADLLALMQSSPYNAVNFEGVATNHQIKYGDKIFHLRMATSVPRQLAKLGVNLATLGNNHSMDFGQHGLFDSLALLNRAGIESFGADLNSRLATRPTIVNLPDRSLCLFSFAKTYPASTWATWQFAGTANPTTKVIETQIKDCQSRGLASIVVFHWGRELEKAPQSYQRELAKACIDAGAIAVIGHHPHVLQEIEVYKGVPIFYSIGNFLFSSLPAHSSQEGAAVRLTFNPSGPPTFDVVQLQVNNRLVKFRTRLLQEGETSALDGMIKNQEPACQKRGTPGHWTCNFKP